MKQLQNMKLVFLGLMVIGVNCMQAMQLQDVSIHPVWYSLNAGKQSKREDIITKYRTICDQLGATENAKIPKKSGTIARVATYNVHYWRNPYGNWNDKDLDKMLLVIKEVNADVLILQEVGGKEHGAWDKVKPAMEKMGYTNVACASTSPEGVYKEGHLYNCIYSKYPFVGKSVEKQYATNPDLSQKMYQGNNANPEQRCFVGAQIQLSKDKVISVYGTHLEVRPIKAKSADGKGRALAPDAARKEQIAELLEYIKNNDTNANVVIGADFNTFRKEDLLKFNIGGKTLWSLHERNWSNILKDTAKDTPKGLEQFVDRTPTTMALDYVASQGYKDSFTRGGFMAPQFTVWSGTMIDFLFLSPTWNLGINGAYAFYTWASDHIPMIMDINISQGSTKPTQPAKQPSKPTGSGKGTLADVIAGQAAQKELNKRKK